MSTLRTAPRRRQQRRKLLLAVLVTMTLSAASAAAVVFLAFVPAGESADGRYLLACVKSDAKGPVHFQYRWDRLGTWSTAQASTELALPLALPVGEGGEGSRVELMVRYDDDPGEEQNIVIQHLHVQSSSSATCQNGWASYEFRVRDAELFLDSPSADEGGGEAKVLNNRLLNARDVV